METIAKMPIFTCQGESLGLDEIVNKNVTSVTINYLSEKKKVKAKGFKGFFGKLKEVQEIKELKIVDPDGIFIIFNLGDPIGAIRFSDEKLLNSIEDFDENTLGASYLMALMKPCMVRFHISNMKQIAWE